MRIKYALDFRRAIDDFKMFESYVATILYSTYSIAKRRSPDDRQ